MSRGRKKPYTQIGVRRLNCSRGGCKNKAEHQWQICSDGNSYRPICKACDVELNRLVLKFMKDPDAESKIKKYEEISA